MHAKQDRRLVEQLQRARHKARQSGPDASAVSHQAGHIGHRPERTDTEADRLCGQIAYEGELGIVIGRLCKNVPPNGAAPFIFGYTCVNDVTAAEVLNENVDFPQWCRSKGYDTFGCLGPVIATDWDWSRARAVTRLDGVERQNYPLSDMIMPPEELVSRISHDMSLLPGDVIACGTSVGIGSIKDGGTVEIHIDGIGSLVNVLSPSAR